jgi:hypothetical protein
MDNGPHVEQLVQKSSMPKNLGVEFVGAAFLEELESAGAGIVTLFAR